MPCKTVHPMLSAYLDRELSGDQMLDIRFHLSTCPSCRQELNELQALKRMLVTCSEVPPPTDLEDRLVQSIRRRNERRVSDAKPMSGILWAGIVACSMLITLAVTQRNRPSIEANTHGADRIAREIQRDKIQMAGSDHFGRTKVVTPTGNPSR